MQPMLSVLKKKRRAFTLIEVLVVVLILGVLVAIAIPFYLKSVSDSEENACKTNMSSIASAEQAQRVRDGGAYWGGTVDSAAAQNDGPLRDLHNAVPNDPGGPGYNYIVISQGSNGFIVRCTNPRHRFQWHNGVWETY
jgi:prepilin-type N-terminal cleavage/methylation domain-containing protein